MIRRGMNIALVMSAMAMHRGVVHGIVKPRVVGRPPPPSVAVAAFRSSPHPANSHERRRTVAGYYHGPSSPSCANDARICNNSRGGAGTAPPLPKTDAGIGGGWGRRSSRATTRRATSSSSSSSSSSSYSSTTTGWINPDALIVPRDLARQSRDDDVPRGSMNGEGGNVGNVNIFFNGHDDDGDAKVMHPSPSGVERVLVRDRLVYVKRDDMLHLPNSNVCGNKGRKFLHLNDMPASIFPDVVVSYGGPQSNAMVALAAIVSSKNAEARRGRSIGDVGGKGRRTDNRKTGGEEDDNFRILDVSDDDGAEGKDDDYYGDDDEDGYNTSMSTMPQSSSIATKTPTPTNATSTKRFVYYTKTMPRYLRKNPSGNLLRAMALGMEIITLGHDEYAEMFGGLHGGSALAPADLEPPVPGRSLWIPQGGACGIAMRGSDALASEIIDYWAANGRGMPLAVCVPGGTCTTALLLHRSIRGVLERRRAGGKETGEGGLSLDIRVVVVPCVGDDEYATRQMQSLDRSVGGKGRIEDMPWVLRPRTDIEYGSARRRSNGYFTFGEPAKAILQCFDEMNEHGLFLDLLYGAPAFSLLLQHWTSRASDCPIAGRQVMYVHSGGLEGIASQLTRYKHKGLIDARTIQTS